MLYLTETEWKEWRIEHEMHKFFILKWEELFSDGSFESWQARSSNTRTILCEIERSAILSISVPVHHTQIRVLLEELDLISKDDVIIKHHFPKVLTIVELMKAEYNKANKQQANQNYERIRELSKIAMEMLTKYLTTTFDVIEDLLFRQPIKYKKELSDLLMLLGTELNNREFSTIYIRESLELFKKTDERPFLSSFNLFKKHFLLDKKNFDCYILIQGSNELKKIFHSDMKIILRDAMKEEIQNAINELLEQNREGLIVEVSVFAKDTVDAARQSMKQLKTIVAMKSLYEPRSLNVIIHPKVGVKLSINNFKIIETQQPLPRYISDSNHPVENLNKLITLIDNISSDDKNLLMASLQYYELSLHGVEQEAKLVNLWIALESLFQNTDGSIIDGITKYVPMIMCTKYLYTILRSVSRDLVRFWKSEKLESVIPLLETPSDYIVHPYDVLKILCASDSKVKEKFLSYIASSPLLLFRVFSLQEGLLKDHAEHLSRLKRHNNNIDWQIRRIYRIRNEIMHRGMLQLRTSIYYHHLYTYYTNTINMIIQQFQQFPEWGLNTIFEKIDTDYKLFLDDLKCKAPLSLNRIYQLSDYSIRDAAVWK